MCSLSVTGRHRALLFARTTLESQNQHSIFHLQIPDALLQTALLAPYNEFHRSSRALAATKLAAMPLTGLQQTTASVTPKVFYIKRIEYSFM
jgi:hypothetical protein